MRSSDDRPLEEVDRFENIESGASVCQCFELITTSSTSVSASTLLNNEINLSNNMAATPEKH
jgi:hypothetical protein